MEEAEGTEGGRVDGSGWRRAGEVEVGGDKGGYK